jgi:hypothetical protein
MTRHELVLPVGDDAAFQVDSRGTPQRIHQDAVSESE